MFNRKYIFKGSIFHCYVSLPECRSWTNEIQMISRKKQIYKSRAGWWQSFKASIPIHIYIYIHIYMHTHTHFHSHIHIHHHHHLTSPKPHPLSLEKKSSERHRFERLKRAVALARLGRSSPSAKMRTEGVTLPETNSSHLKIDPWKRRFLLETTIFRGYVSFRECNWIITLSACSVLFSLKCSRILILV